MGNTNSKIMPAQQMLATLVAHGCQDLTRFLKRKASTEIPFANGGCGDVWKSKLRNGNGHIDVAIKVWRLSADDINSNKSLKGAMRELYYWSKLDHENVQKLLGVAMFQGRLGMVSEWMENGNLHTYIREEKPVDRYQLCLQVVKAVHYIHEAQMVHGDLKAQNFLLSSDGIVKLADFDHSIIAECSMVFSTRANNKAGGTLRWMAPELILPEQPQRKSSQTDIYALGMTLLEIITGNVPFSQLSDTAVYGALQRQAIPEGRYHFEGANGDRLWTMLCRCWDRDPAARPTASEILNLVKELQPVEETQQAHANPPSPEALARKASDPTSDRRHATTSRRQTSVSSLGKGIIRDWFGGVVRSMTISREPTLTSEFASPSPPSGSSRSSSGVPPHGSGQPEGVPDQHTTIPRSQSPSNSESLLVVEQATAS